MCRLYLKPFYHNIGDITIENEVFSHSFDSFLKFYKWKCVDTNTWKGYKKQAKF